MYQLQGPWSQMLLENLELPDSVTRYESVRYLPVNQPTI